MTEEPVKIERTQIERARLLLEILAHDQRVAAGNRADLVRASRALDRVIAALWDEDDPLPETVYDPLPFGH